LSDAPEKPGGRLAASRGAVALFLLGLALYAGTRFSGLTEFPIFFFCDEAVQANVAERLVRNHFRDSDGVLLPPYFKNDQRWAMSLNIYLLAAPVVTLGKTITVTRGTFVAVSLFAAAAAGLALSTAGVGLWWTAPYVLALMPMDFLHSRQALETTPGPFAGFLWAYLLYRLRSPKSLFLALLFGAATFYSYTAGQGIMLVLGVLLALVDLPYHLRQSKRLWAAAALCLLVLAIPFLREQRLHPGSTREQLLVLHSYWVAPDPLSVKLETFGRQYLLGLDPRYWFFPNEAELVRHRMDTMAYVPLALAPFVVLGVAACLARWRRSPAHRVFLLSPLAVPFAAAMHHRQALRVLPMVVPIVLLAAAGADELARLVRQSAARRVLAPVLAAVLGAFAVRLTFVSLTEGPLWFRDYGLYGMQYGAKQIFEGIRESLERSPTTRVLLTSSWANNPDEFLDFFLQGPDRDRAQMGGIETYLLYRTDLTPQMLFVLTEEEYRKGRKDPKLVVSAPERTIRYPDGSPGFRFVRLGYSDRADAMFAAELETRRKPRERRVEISGESVLVRHSVEDGGQPSDLFDGRFDSTLRGLEANPFLLDLDFDRPREIGGIDLTLTMMECDVTVTAFPAGGGAPVSVRREIRGLTTDRLETFLLPGGKVAASRLRVEVFLPFAGPRAHVELRELAFR
jgi:hypothetical protein